MNKENLLYFFPKVRNRLIIYRNRFLKYFDINRLAMLGYRSFTDASAFTQRLCEILGKYTPLLLGSVSDCDKTVILSCADQALRHEFNLLGSGVVKLDPIDWHCDFKSGTCWQKKYYLELGLIKGADIKVPWELSRCQHLLWLSEAYLLTEDKRYAQEVIDEINWWIDDNPLMYTVNWTCAMDVAFRAVNWMFALNMISEYDGFDDDFANKVSRSLWQHGFFIINNLEKIIPDSNNHFTSDLVGLLYLGVLFSHTRKGRKWKGFAYKELVAETMSQALASGVHYERSVSYHRMMTEMLSYPVYMLKRIGESVPEEVVNRLKAMYAYIANYTKPNGYAPLVGDNDDGRFVLFLRRDFREHDYLNTPESVENRIISVGMRPMFCTSKTATRLYSDAGVAIAHEANNYLFVSNGGFSKRPSGEQVCIGTHTHNDLLSFELALDGKDIVVDAGTYLYTSSKEDRDAFRSTAKHNTVVVDGEEQNGFEAPFVMKRNVKVGDLQQEGVNTFTGDYTTIKGQMNHQRSFKLSNEGLEITDSITKEGAGHNAKFFLHLANGLTPVIIEGCILIIDDAIIEFSHQPDSIVIIDDTLSPSFGVFIDSKTIVASYSFDNELNIITSINKHGS